MPKHRTATLLAAAMSFATQARAAPFDRRVVPDDAKFVFAIDMDAARTSVVGKAINNHLSENPDCQKKIAQLSLVTGMAYPQDLHDVTLYARGMGDEAVVVVAHARVDRPRILLALSTTPDHATHRVGNYDVVRWTDHGRTMFGAFHDDGTLVIAHSEANVSAALDVIDGNAPATPVDGPLSGTTPPSTRPAVGPTDRPLMFLAMTNVPGMAIDRGGIELPGPLKQVQGGCLSMVETAGALSFHVNLTATTPDAAEQLRTAAEGLRAMVGFTAGDPNARSDLKQAWALLSGARFGRGDRTMTADLTIPADTVLVTANEKTFAVGLGDPKTTTRPSKGN